MPVAVTTPTPWPDATPVAGEEHVFALGRADFLRADRAGRLRRRDGLTGQRALLGVKLRALEQSQVRRYDVARFEQDDVAGHERFARQHGAFAVAQDGGVRRGHRAQRLERVLRLCLLHRADQRVRHHDTENQQRVGEVRLPLQARGRKGNRGCAKQDQHHEIAELQDEALQKRFLSAFFQGVRAVFLQARFGVRRAQPAFPVAFQNAERLRRVHRVERRVFRRLF